MEETKKLKSTFNLIFIIILSLVFVTVSSFVSELYEIHKKEKTTLINNIILKLEVQKEEINQEFYIKQSKSIAERISKNLNSFGITSFEIASIEKDNCISLTSKSTQCSNEFLSIKNYQPNKTIDVSVNDYTFILLPVRMFHKNLGKIVIKIPHSYTSANRLYYLALNILPLFFIILLWGILYRFVEKNIITPQIENIAVLESNRKVYESVLKVTHDLRAPLSSLDLVSKNTPQNEYSELFKLSINRIDSIVDNFLYESKQTQNDFININLQESLKNLITEFEFKYPNIKYTICSQINALAYLKRVDYISLERSLSNIISNSSEAIISNGLINLSINRVDDGIKFKISDNGVGIKASDHKLIFKQGHTTKLEGNGIGLHSTYKWLSKVKGKISFDSEQGKGTQFYIFMPCKFN